MEFIFETIYDQKGVSVMAKALRKTIRKKRSKRTRIFGAIIVLCAIMLTIPEEGEEFIVTGSMIATWVTVGIMTLTLLFEDKINGYIARKRMLTGMHKSITTFKEDCYTSETELGKTEFYYNNIHVLAETDEYFVFLFKPNHAQIYDKKGMKQGSLDEFRSFIEQKTEKEFQRISGK